MTRLAVSLHSREILARNASLAEHYSVWGKRKNEGRKRWKSRTFRVSLQSPLPSDLFCDRLRFLDLRKNTGYFAVSLTSLTRSDIWHHFASPTISDDTSVWKCIEIRKINVIWRTRWILLQIANHFIAIHIFKWSFLFLAFDKGDWSFKHLTIKRGIIETKRLITSPSEIRDAYHSRFRLRKQWNSKTAKVTSFPRNSHWVLLKYSPNILLWFNKVNLGKRSTLANRLRGSFHP